MPRSALIVGMLLLGLMPVRAAIALPVELQTCFDAGKCYFFGESSGGISPGGAFIQSQTYIDIRPGTLYYQQFVTLLEIPLHASSRTFGVAEFPDETFTWNRPFTGSIWMSVADNYTVATDEHWLTLYFDQILIDGNPYTRPTANLGMTTADLLAGSAEYSQQYLGFDYETDEDAYIISGDLQYVVPSDPYFFYPIDPLDIYDMIFNPLFLEYSLSADGLNLQRDPINYADPRPSVFSYNYFSSVWSGETGDYAFNVNEVPLPAAVWLMFSAIASLGLFGRKH